MRVFIIAAFVFALLAAAFALSMPRDQSEAARRRINNNNKQRSAAAKNHDSDLIEAINGFMCATGSKYCVDAKGPNEYLALRDKVVMRGMEFAAEMVNPTSIEHFVMRSALPRDAQLLFETAQGIYRQAGPLPAGLSTLGKQRAAVAAVKAAVKQLRGDDLAADKYAIFGFLPQFAGDAAVGSSQGATVNTNCVGPIKVTATKAADGSVTVTTAPQHGGFLCSDFLMLLAGGEAMRIQIIETQTPVQWTFATSDFKPANNWYLNRHGIRVLKFPKDVITTIGQLLATVNMLAGFAEMPLTNSTFAANVQFLNDYVEVTPRMQPKTTMRTGGDSVGLNLPSDYIQSGDSLIVMRPDGMDTMLGWADGWTSGHSTIAMRDTSNKLHVCESTTKDAYWPTNGVQCTPFDTWIKQVERAEMSVLLTPLSPQYRAKFNAAAAWSFFRQIEGVNYGFPNMLLGWVDTVNSNFPCLPPDFKTCLDPNTVEQLAFLIDKLQGDANTNLFRQAVNFRTGTWGQGKTVLEAFYAGAMSKNMTFADIYTAPEQDSWMYNMTFNNGTDRRAPSSVCCVFVCRMWKAAGIFSEINSEINCAEADLWGIYSLKIFDSAKEGTGRPQICQKADPNNRMCQLSGKVTLHAHPDYNTRTPYKYMNQKCPARCPEYIRTPGC